MSRSLKKMGEKEKEIKKSKVDEKKDKTIKRLVYFRILMPFVKGKCIYSKDYFFCSSYQVLLWQANLET